ncbi:hypothetical protein [Paenibacillus silvisoli]|uniref:hypothetical protein n=1 Tax=Paenibacillus silvisoli TaxID=3110539 RepID=UPI0028055318|nr:hypothetical protein [Paenibacillus silvisoli]
MSKLFSIGELSSCMCVSVRAIRYYEEIGYARFRNEVHVKVIGAGNEGLRALNRLRGLDPDIQTVSIAYGDELNDIRRAFGETELLSILAGIDHEAALVIAQEARKWGILTVGIVTDSFEEGGANRHVQVLAEHVDLLFDFSVYFDHQCCEDMIAGAIEALSALVLKAPIDLRDLHTIVKNKGRAYLAAATSTGASKISDAMDQLFSSSLLPEGLFAKTSFAILTIMASSDLSLFDAEHMVDEVRSKLADGTNILFGTIIEPDMHDAMKVSLVLTEIRSGAMLRRIR